MNSKQYECQLANRSAALRESRESYTGLDRLEDELFGIQPPKWGQAIFGGKDVYTDRKLSEGSSRLALRRLGTFLANKSDKPEHIKRLFKALIQTVDIAQTTHIICDKTHYDVIETGFEIMDGELSNYQPKTPLGAKLLELRRKIAEAGETFLSSEEIEKELSERRSRSSDTLNDPYFH